MCTPESPRSTSAASNPAGWGPRTKSVVRLADGATATAQLQVADAGNYGCTDTAAGLRVYPPKQFTSKVVPYPLGACARELGRSGGMQAQ